MPLPRPRAALLAALALLPLAAPARAQDPDAYAVSTTVARPVRVVYRAALEALGQAGYALRARMLDQMLVTQPAAGSPAVPDAGGLHVAVMLELKPSGGSTEVSVRTQVLTAQGGRPARSQEQAAMAAGMAASVEVTSRLTERLDALPADAPGADPREAGDEFGYGRGNPVRVGGDVPNGAARQRRYLDALRGPQGQPVTYTRLGSCCLFRTPHSERGQGALDAYEVTYEGLARPVVLYFDMYTPPGAALRAPEGFGFAGGAAPDLAAETARSAGS
ncbi:MAG TPA: hypothetical protein VFQ45_15650 [Longimicrobium sp.]|nr:hypothetical protein [Longimicrobium sp.]